MSFPFKTAQRDACAIAVVMAVLTPSCPVDSSRIVDGSLLCHTEETCLSHTDDDDLWGLVLGYSTGHTADIHVCVLNGAWRQNQMRYIDMSHLAVRTQLNCSFYPILHIAFIKHYA